MGMTMRLLRPSRRRMAGVNMVGLMVGIALGLMLTAVMLRMFADASSSAQNLQRVSQQVENGRYAEELLRDELQLAGFFGEVDTTTAAYSVPDPCALVPAGFAAAPLALPTAIRGYGATEVLGCLPNRRAGTDALAVRRLDTVSLEPGALPAGNATDHLQHSFCDTDAVASRMVLARNPASFVARNRACDAVNPVRAYVSRIYFIANCNRCAGAGDGMPTLKRLDLVDGVLRETPLVEGVDMLRFEYGFDTDNDGAADQFLTQAQAAGPASEWRNVVAVRTHLVLRATERALGAGLATAQRFDFAGAGVVDVAADGFTRRAYSSTVRLVNVGGPREVQ
jgi:type IV pilus assembly protein PilW